MIPSGWMIWVLSVEFVIIFVAIGCGLGHVLSELTKEDK